MEVGRSSSSLVSLGRHSLTSAAAGWADCADADKLAGSDARITHVKLWVRDSGGCDCKVHSVKFTTVESGAHSAKVEEEAISESEMAKLMKQFDDQSAKVALLRAEQCEGAPEWTEEVSKLLVLKSKVRVPVSKLLLGSPLLPQMLRLGMSVTCKGATCQVRGFKLPKGGAQGDTSLGNSTADSKSTKSKSSSSGFKVGALVVLSPVYSAIGDASSGPLKPSDVGKIVSGSPGSSSSSTSWRVEAVTGSKVGSGWHYREPALRLKTSTSSSKGAGAWSAPDQERSWKLCQLFSVEQQLVGLHGVAEQVWSARSGVYVSVS